MSDLLRLPARCSAYLIALLLAAVWSFGALATLTRPLLALGRPQIGDTILWVAGAVALPPHATLMFAKLLAGLEFMVGVFLLAAVIGAVCEKVRFGSCDDAMLDVALFVAGIASVVAALPGLIYGGQLLLGTIGELMLCVIASGCAIYGRGYLVKEELPRPARPAFGYPDAR